MTPITLRGLCKKFGSTEAVRNVDLDINAGDLFFLLGPSGCGKTTLLRMLAGFTDPTSGSIRFGEKDVTHAPPNKRNTGMVFQGYALWPHMTVFENVAFGLNIRGVASDEKKKRVEEALASVRMQEYGKRKPNELSGGQQQRVALARALVIKPDVLLLDEPLSNLDAKLRLEMRSQIKEICSNAEITAVYVTHDQKEALSMADGVAVVRSGKVVQQGPPRELYTRPSSRFVAEFLGETNVIAAEIVGRDGDKVMLDCPAGRFCSTITPENLPETGNVSCSIRPEAIQLHQGGKPEGDNGVNRFDVRRTELVYLGEMAQHQLVAGDLTLKAFELNPGPVDHADGEIHIAFAPEDVVLLQD